MLMGWKATVGLALASVVLGSSGPVTLLRRELKAGSIDEYEVRCTQTTIPGEGMPGDPRTVKIGWNAAYKIEGLTDKGADLKVDITDYSFKAEGAMAPPNQPKERKAAGILDDRNRVDPHEPAPRKPTTTQHWLLLDFVEFPEKEVAVGDSWDITLPQSIPLGNKKVTLPAKLTGEEKHEARDAWVVVIEKKGVPTENKVQFRMGQSGDMKEGKIVGKADVSIKILVEKGTGRTLSVTSKVRADQEMIVADAPIATPSSIEYSSTMKLKSAKA